LVRCAIYTRKSTDENLDNDFNSLDAQRESAEMYIRSQTHEGWVALPARYDDGAYSGATIERPALQRLLADVEAGKVDTIIVYKIDRFSRSLLDFTKLIETLEAHGVSLVSVTQQFNTTTSMGRLTLNILLSFAQFEREMGAERVRDKIAAAKRRGKYVGGSPPFGYDVDHEARRLSINSEEATLVRFIFRRYLQLGSVVTLASELNAQGHRTKGWTTRKGTVRQGSPWEKNHVYRMLSNPLYVGLVEHQGQTYPGEHEAILEQSLWDEVQRYLARAGRSRGRQAGRTTPALLQGIIRCGCCDSSMGITFTTKNARKYRYYVCQRVKKASYGACPIGTVPAGDVERAVLLQLRRVFASPEMVAGTMRGVQAREDEERERLASERVELERNLGVVKGNAARLLQTRLADGAAFVSEELARLDTERVEIDRKLADVTGKLDFLASHNLTVAALTADLSRLDPIWDHLVPAEQQRVAQLLLDQVVVYPDRVEIALRADDLYSLVAELQPEEEGHVA